MVEYRILREETSQSDPNQKGLTYGQDVEAAPVEHSSELAQTGFSHLQNQGRLKERNADYVKIGGNRKTLSLIEARQKEFIDFLDVHLDEDVQKHNEIQPWKAVLDATSISQIEDQEKDRLDNHSKSQIEKSDDERSSHQEVTAQKQPLGPAKVIEKQDSARLNLVDKEDSISFFDDSTDHELMEKIDSYSSIEPWQAIENKDCERDLELELEESLRKLNQTRFKQLYERPALDRRNNTEPEDPRQEVEIEVQVANEVQQEVQLEVISPVSCSVPTEIAQALVELGPLEPETIEHLNEKYAYVLKHLRDDLRSAPDDLDVAHDGEFAEPVEEQSRAPEQIERAHLQIEEIDRLDSEMNLSPRLQQFTTLSLQPDLESAAFEIIDAKLVVWEKTEYPATLQQILDEREEKTETSQQHESTRQTAARVPTREKYSRELIATIQRDLQRQEHERDELDDAEPPPSDFCTIRVTESITFVIRYWGARTIEEFDQTDPGIPATPEAIQEIVGKDREYKLWLARRRHVRHEIDKSRTEEGEQIVKSDQDYELEDFDR